MMVSVNSPIDISYMRGILLTLMLSAVVAFGAVADDDLHFIWGAEAGTGIDMGGDNMSTINLRALLGYSGPYIEVAGIGAGVDMVMSNSTRMYPVYAHLRSSFTRKPSLLFGDLRGGIAFNQIPSVGERRNFFLQPGVGIHLATGATFSSYLTLSYTYNSLSFYGDKADSIIHGLNLATIAIGVTF